MTENNETTEAHARAIMGAGLGRAELMFATSLTSPLFWIVRENNGYKVRNGSVFFLDAGKGSFGVTANHVLKGLAKDRETKAIVTCQIGSEILFDESRVIDAQEGIDIATFRVTDDEIKSVGKFPYLGYQGKWPPAPPQQDRGVFYSGFPGTETILLAPSEVSFGAAPCGGVASSISDRDVSSLIARSNLIDVMGGGPLPPRYNFQGLSGGPMLAVVEQNGLRLNRLAGVIIQGPNTLPDDANESIEGFEVVKARRAHFIRPDGTLDKYLCTW
jgi:hypothetical protein